MAFLMVLQEKTSNQILNASLLIDLYLKRVGGSPALQ